MKNIILFITIGLLFLSTLLQAQQISHVTFFQSENNTITVGYFLKKSSINQNFQISLYVSTDNGRTFQGPLKAVSGDVGENIQAGRREIVWDVFKDVTSLEGDILFEVKAAVIKEKKWFISYAPGFSIPTPDYISPIGARISRLGGLGYYAAIQFNFDFLFNGNHDYNLDEIRYSNFETEGYYAFSDKSYKPRFSIKGGVTQQILKRLFAYGGAGYGIKSLIYKAEEFSYDNSSPTGEFTAIEEYYSTSGLELELGLMYRTNKLLISAGASNLNYLYTFIDLGIGIEF